MFSDKEKDILRQINLPVDEISKKVFLSPSTVKGYIQIILDKLQVSTRTNAVIAALKGKYINVDDFEIDYTKEKECEL